MKHKAVIATLFLAVHFIGCSSDGDFKDLRSKNRDSSNQEELALLENPASLALGVDDSAPWPQIHRSDAGTKESPAAGPITPGGTFEEWQGNTVVLMIVGHKYLYHQAAVNSVVRMFDPSNIKQGPIGEINLGYPWPLSGGGIIDTNHQIWWNAYDRLVRTDEDLSQPVYSEHLMEKLRSRKPYLLFNGLAFLPDGNLLVSTTTEELFVVSSTPDGNQVLRHLNTMYLSDFMLGDKRVLARETSFNPRPMTDRKGGFFITSGQSLQRIDYDAASKSFKNKLTWMFKNPEPAWMSDLDISNPVLVGDLICVASEPLVTVAVQNVYCLNQANGQLVHKFTPFPKAAGKSAAHTLGAIEKDGLMFTIVDDDMGRGGVAALDLKSGKVRWTKTLNHVSDALLVSTGSRRVYVAAQDSLESAQEVVALDADSGAAVVLDSRSSTEYPRDSLGAIGKDGSLFQPVPGGFIRLKN